MKKTLLLAGAALVFTAANANAFSPHNLTTSIGLDYSYMENTYGKGRNNVVEDDFNTFAINAGLRGTYFGAEAYIQRANKEAYKQPGLKTNTNYWSYGVDFLGFYPIYNNMEVLGGVGLGEYKIWAKHAGHGTSKDSGYGVRFTGGLQFNLDRHWGIRAAYRYTNMEDSWINHSEEYSVGLRYSF